MDGNCQSDYIYKHSSHDNYSRKKHILVYHEHFDQDENVKLLDEYKSKFILPLKYLEDFSKSISLSFLSYRPASHAANAAKKKLSNSKDDEPIVEDSGIYILQQIQINNNKFMLFFDTDCSDLVSRYSAVQKIGDRSRSRTNAIGWCW